MFSKYLLLRFFVVSASSDFQVVKGAAAEVKAEHPVKVPHHY